MDQLLIVAIELMASKLAESVNIPHDDIFAKRDQVVECDSLTKEVIEEWDVLFKSVTEEQRDQMRYLDGRLTLLNTLENEIYYRQGIRDFAAHLIAAMRGEVQPS